MAINKIDYDVLDTGVSTYSSQASALDDVLTALNNMNSQLQAGWTNKTSEAFISRYEREHKVALEKARDSIQEISDYIAEYMRNRQDEDAQGASAISG